MRKTSTRGPSILTFFGIFGLVVAVVLGVAGVVTFSTFFGSSWDQDTANSLVLARTDGDTLQFEATAGTNYAVVSINTVVDPGQAVTVTVTDPSGTPVRVRTSSVRQSITVSDTTASQVATFTATRSGNYTIALEGKDNWDFAVVDASVIEDFARHLLGGILLCVGAGIMGLAGLILTIVGGVWWGSRRKNARFQAMQPSPAGPMIYPGHNLG